MEVLNLLNMIQNSWTALFMDQKGKNWKSCRKENRVKVLDGYKQAHSHAGWNLLVTTGFFTSTKTCFRWTELHNLRKELGS